MLTFIPSSSLEKLALIIEFCIYIGFVTYGLIRDWLGIIHLIVFIKPFEYVSDIRFQNIYNFRKILSTNVVSGIISITGKFNVIVNKE